MNKQHTVFNPDLKPHFSEQLIAEAQTQTWTVAELYYQLQQGNRFPCSLAIAHHWLKQRLETLGSNSNQALANLEQQAIQIPVSSKLSDSDTQYYQFALKQIAPTIFSSPHWLQGISNSASCDHLLAAKILNLYRQLNDRTSELNEYRAKLLQHNIELPACHHHAFIEQSGIQTKYFEFAAQNLSLARLPRVYFPELLGYTLAYCQFQPVHHYVLPTSLMPQTESIQSIKDIIETYRQCQPEHQHEISKRLKKGYDLYRNTLESLLNELTNDITQHNKLDRTLGQIFSSKAFAALGHHQHIKLGGIELDEWFKQKPFQSEAFIKALQQSTYVDRQNPEQSRFFKLFDFDGPMFGVLNDQEFQILKTNILQTQTSQNSAKPIINENPAISSASLQGQPAIQFTQLNNPELYYYLINADLYPEVITAAQQKVHKLIFWTRICHRPPFKHYQKSTFTKYFKNLYESEMQAYQPLNGKPKFSKNTYRWGIEQMAPAILVDGCWLQGLQHSAIKYQQDLSVTLLTTYYDEIGNGINQQNHPLIYQQLLHQQQIALPPISEQTFSKHPGFIPHTFDLPVYLLCIGLLPEIFLPEILGLNLAIELSGLGKQYMQLSDALRYWGINSKIIDIHISIDNLASGHSALALKAAHNYLEDISNTQGLAAADHHWARIYTGFCSLKQAGLLFALSMIKHHLFHKSYMTG